MAGGRNHSEVLWFGEGDLHAASLRVEKGTALVLQDRELLLLPALDAAPLAKIPSVRWDLVLRPDAESGENLSLSR